MGTTSAHSGRSAYKTCSVAPSTSEVGADMTVKYKVVVGDCDLTMNNLRQLAFCMSSTSPGRNNQSVIAIDRILGRDYGQAATKGNIIHYELRPETGILDYNIKQRQWQLLEQHYLPYNPGKIHIE